MITIYVPAVPIAQPRPRATIRGNHATVYHAAGPVDAFKALVRLAASTEYDGPPMTGPIRVAICFVMPRPKRLIWKTKPMPREWHTIKPDRDNLDKAVLDALSGLLWVDDCQVCDGRVRKMIASGDEQPHVSIQVTELTSKGANDAHSMVR